MERYVLGRAKAWMIVLAVGGQAACTDDADGPATGRGTADGETTSSALQTGLARSTEKILPTTIARESDEPFRIRAARGEWEAFQVVIRAERDSTGVEVNVSDFVGPGGFKISADDLLIYEERFVEIDPPSLGGVAGNPRDAGRYPDPLVPVRDPYGSERVAAPARIASLPAGETAALFVDMEIPREAPPGEYMARVAVSAEGEEPALLRVALTVWNFELPAARSVTTSFHLGRSGLRRFHGGFDSDSDSDVLARVFENYEKTLHRHRIDTLIPYHGDAEPLKAAEDGSLLAPDWADFDAIMGPRLDGSFYDDGVPMRAFSMGFFAPGAEGGLQTELSDEAYVEASRLAAEHLKEKGWFERVYIYTFDEPYLHEGSYERVVKDVGLMVEGDPDWKGHFMSTNHYVEELDGAIDIWVPDTKNYESWFWGEDGLKGRDFYEARRALGETLWFYNCLCTIPPYAGYDIDTKLGHEPRILKWGAFYEGAVGYLYWSSNFWVLDDPWGTLIDLASFPGFARNGDGFLLYPGNHDGTDSPAGSPEGVALDGPVESYRLKMIRDGLEDWELFLLASELFGRERIKEMIEPAYNRMGDHPGKLEGALDMLITFEGNRMNLTLPAVGKIYDEARPPWTLDDRVLHEVRDAIGDMVSAEHAN
jgi:hypothetical protein